MPEVIDLKKGKYHSTLRYSGLVDLEGLFKMIKEWLDYRHFRVFEPAHKRKPMPRGFEHEVEFQGIRKETEYVRYIINVYIHAQYTDEVEVVEKGVKKKIQNTGSMYMEIWPTVELDWQARWEKTPFMKKVRKFFHEYIIKTYIMVVWVDRVYYITYKLHTKLKEFLDLQSKYNAYEEMWQT
jgi:hypothetical protein